MRESCPLCSFSDTTFFFLDVNAPHYREFYHCETCDLVFVPDRFFVSPEDEKARYLQHNNDPADQGYRDFLSRLYTELKPHLIPNSKGLDYGAGPGPALAMMMIEDGFNVRTYDTYFYDDKKALEEDYDFIACTETAEHFRYPALDFRILDGILKRPGWLGVMTSMLDDWSDFPGWYYHRDPTHICFYSRKTMLWIAASHSWEPLFPRQNVVLFNKR